ncbi:MAG TPA: hypothetical protein VIV11_28635 [Kofleriaceae bacterium]
MARAFVLLMVLAGSAHAERYLHTGLDIRSDLGAHAVRLPIGYRACAWDATLVLDPMIALDSQHDLDVLGEYYVRDRVGVLFGWRWSAIAIAGGVHHQQRSIIGVTGVGPDFFDRRLRTSFSFEIATLWVKHGGGVESQWISFDRNLDDSILLGIFVRLEYAHAL